MIIAHPLHIQLARKGVLNNEVDVVKEEFDTIKDILDKLPDFCPNAKKSHVRKLKVKKGKVKLLAPLLEMS